mgnify:FL=1
MPELIYAANNRLPTEKAHGLQIAQMAEAFAQAGYTVTLVAPRRINTAEMRAAGSLWAHYGVERVFDFRRLPALDLFPILPRGGIAFAAQTITFALALALWLLPRRPDALYTRDLFLAVWLALIRPRTALVYEAHALHHSRLGRALERFVVRRAWVVALTAHLAEALRAQGADRVLVAHDGFRAARFANMPSQAEARAALGVAPEAFVVGYVGRLHTMGMPKGLDTLVDAIAWAAERGGPIDLLLVGGPDEGVRALREQWAARGLPGERLHAAGQVPPAEIPRYLAALDVGALPLPWTEHFAYFASAIKLFEYLAAGCAVIASDLPSTAEVVRDGETALLAPPGDAQAWADALARLRDDPALRERLGKAARALSTKYTWQARAERIRAFVAGGA